MVDYISQSTNDQRQAEITKSLRKWGFVSGLVFPAGLAVAIGTGISLNYITGPFGEPPAPTGLMTYYNRTVDIRRIIAEDLKRYQGFLSSKPLEDENNQFLAGAFREAESVFKQTYETLDTKIRDLESNPQLKIDQKKFAHSNQQYSERRRNKLILCLGSAFGSALLISCGLLFFARRGYKRAIRMINQRHGYVPDPFEEQG